MTAAKSALVIGGGVAGPVTAMALRRAGIEATVYEAYPSRADGIGVTLTLAPNGVAAMGLVGAEEAVTSIGLPMNRTVSTDGLGGLIGAFPHVTVEPTTLGLWRDKLTVVLHEQAEAQGIRIEYGKRLVNAEESAGGVTAHFEDGTTATADVLIGADGIRSRVRTLIDPNAPRPKVLPLLNFGGAAEYTPPAEPDAMYFDFGKKAFFGYWVQPDGRTAWFSNVPDSRILSFAKANEISQAEWLRYLRERHADDVPARDVLKHTNPDAVVAIGSIESMPPVPHWYRGRMVLVGDAVHAPSPSSGQGASMATESAIQVARCLRDFPDPSSAFAAYEQLRRQRVEKIIDRGVKTTYVKTVGPTTKKIMKAMMPLALRTFLNPDKTLGPEQRYRIDWDASVANEVPAEALSGKA